MAALTFEDAAPQGGALTFEDAAPGRTGQELNYTKSLLAQGQLPSIFDAIGSLGNIAGGSVNDAARSAFEGISGAIPGFVKTAFNQTPIGIAQQVGSAAIAPVLSSANDAMSSLTQSYPQTSHFASGVGNMVGAVGVADGVDSGLRSIPEIAPKTVPLASQNLGDVADYLYGNATRSGVQFSPQLTTDLSGSVRKAQIGGVKGILQPEEAAFNNDLDFYHQFSGQPLSIGDVQDLDQQLGRLSNKYKNNGVPTEYSNRINNVKYDLRDMAYGQDASNYLQGGDTQAIGDMLSGNDFYNKKKQAMDAEKILANASLSDNSQSAIRSGVRSLLKNDRKMNFYSAADQDALKTALKTGFLGTATSVLGNGAVDAGIGTIAGALGGGVPGAVAGAVAGKFISSPFAAAGEALQAGRLNKALGQMQSSLPEVTGVSPQFVNSGPIPQTPAPLQLNSPSYYQGGGYIGQPVTAAPSGTIYQPGPNIPQLPAPGFNNGGGFLQNPDIAYSVNGSGIAQPTTLEQLQAEFNRLRSQ